MEKFVINGGHPLSGEITVAGNKNAALPTIAACLLTEEELILRNVPRIRDTEAQVGLLESLGVHAIWSSDNELRLRADSVADTSPPEDLAQVLGRRGVGDRVRAEAQLVIAAPDGVDAEALQQADLGLGVADPWHVAQDELLLGEQAGGDGRQGGVLVPGDRDLPRQGMAAVDDELLHGRGLG